MNGAKSLTLELLEAEDINPSLVDAESTSIVSPVARTTMISPQEAVLRNALHTILQETSGDEESFAALREICHETLLAKERRISSNSSTRTMLDGVADEEVSPTTKTHPIAPPRSPQERLMALVPNAIEKSKTRYQRRTSPGKEVPRWKKIDGDEPPITDLTVIFTGDTVPDGFTKVDRSPSGFRADLNKGGRGHFVYLCLSKARATKKAPISEILVVFPERNEFVPTDYEIVQRRGVPVNLNTGTQGEKVYLCYKRSPTSSIVDIMVLFPKKGEKLPYGYMKVDKSPDGHFADLNSNSGGTEVCICYKKKINAVEELHKKWLFVTVGIHGEDELTERINQTNSKHSKGVLHFEPQEKMAVTRTSADPQNKDSTTNGVHFSSATITHACKGKTMSWKETVEYYMYPLLLASYTRHGNAADTAIHGISQCLDSGLFDEFTGVHDLCRLEVIVDAVTSACQQGVKSRFALALPFYRKIIRKCYNGFNPFILHAILKALVFIGDFDSSLVKAVEDELVYNIMNRYETELIERHTERDQLRRQLSALSTEERAREFVLNLVDDVSTSVHVAKIIENMLGTFKSHASIHSPGFCFDMISSMSGLCQTTVKQNALQLVVTLTKAVHRKSPMNISDTGLERDHCSITNSLRALNVTLVAAGTYTREHRAFGQLIRRFVLTTVNSTSLVGSLDVFRANLTVISTLWNHYRRHLKVELALVFEHLFLKILRSTSTSAWHHQMDIMHELTPLLQLPHNVVEIFSNFDMDRVQQWKIFEHLSAAFCSIAEGSYAFSSGSGGNNPNNMGTDDAEDSLALRLQIQAINVILAVARSIMDASGHAHLINRDARTRHLSMEYGGWEQDEQDGEEKDDGRSSVSSPVGGAPIMPVASAQTSTDPSPKTPRSFGSKTYGTLSVRQRNELHKRNQQLLKRAMEISSSKSLKKAIEYLVAMNFIKRTPREITSFLRIYHDFFDEAEIGDYLGEGDEDFKVQVRLSYVRAISFEGMTLVESLRHFLTNGGFRLPGEAQKIERMVEAFAQCYVEDAPTAFSSADTAMIIAYSIIMLNTDLHNPQVKKNKMSKEQFIKNNRGIDNGKDLPKRFLEEIYDDIARNPMQLKGSHVVTPRLSKTREMSNSGGSNSTLLLDLEHEKFRASLAKSVTQAEELMKDLSQSYVSFNFVGVDTCISPDLIKILFERVWFYFLALSTSILCDNNQSDLSMIMHCLDLLRFCISTCLFLGMSVERQAFCKLLTKVQGSLHEKNEAERLDEELDEYSTLDEQLTMGKEAQEWMESIEAAAAIDDPWCVIGDIHIRVNKMKEAIQRRQKSEALNSVIKRINRSHFYLKDTTQFLKEGDLTKKCRSRNQTYRFFLFNDQLLYADRNMAGYWNPHNSLRLKLTRISDVPDSVLHKHAFQIHNPVKSFVVLAESHSAKAEWMRLIEEAIAEAAKKINRNARRLSTQGVHSQLSTSESSENSSTPAATTATTSSTGALVSVASTASEKMKVLIRRGSRLASLREKDQLDEVLDAGVLELIEGGGNSAPSSPMKGKSSTTMALVLRPTTISDNKQDEAVVFSATTSDNPSQMTLSGEDDEKKDDERHDTRLATPVCEADDDNEPVDDDCCKESVGVAAKELPTLNGFYGTVTDS